MIRFRRALPAFGLLALCGAIAIAEGRSPLRARREAWVTHTRRNLALAALAAVPSAGLEVPIALAIGRFTERHRIGIVPQLPLPPWARAVVGIVLLDYSLYLWHRLTHEVPLLWRFHQVHHLDRDMDTTTALRFHAGEIVLSVGWRALAMFAIGATPRDFELWQRGLIASIVFHHANLRLSPALERRLGWFIMTPRLHAIHHADAPALQASNWSSGLAWWDRLHGTFRPADGRDDLAIGLPAFRSDHRVTLGASIALPFGSRRDAWKSETTT